MEEGASMVKRSRNGDQESSHACELFRQQIPAFLNRDLSEKEGASMEQHRDSCGNCRVILERAVPVDCMHVFQHISDYIDDEVPAELRAQMRREFSVSNFVRLFKRLLDECFHLRLWPGTFGRLYEHSFSVDVVVGWQASTRQNPVNTRPRKPPSQAQKQTTTRKTRDPILTQNS